MQSKLRNYLQKFFQLYLTLLIILIVVNVTALIILTFFQSQALLFFELRPSTAGKIYLLDLVVSLLILLNFSIFFLAAKDKNQYLKNYWILILAGIPFDFIIFQLLGVGFFLINFIFRLIHIIALIKSIGKFGAVFIAFTKKTGLSYGITFFVVFFLVASTSFLVVEMDVNPEVNDYEDSAWYTIVSMTTTGYGDIVPVTGLGRFLGTLMMVAGLAFTGFATASVASILIEKFQEERDKDREMALKIYEEISKKRDRENKEIKDSLKEILNRMDEE